MVFADTAAALDAACSEAPLCAMAFLDRRSRVRTEDDGVSNEASAFEKQTLAAETAAGSPLRRARSSCSWTSRTSGRSRPRSSVTPSDAPRFVVASFRKNRFATHSGAFEARALVSFLEDVLNARTKTRMVQEIARLVDGGEGAYEPEVVEDVEEEFDLSAS